MGHELMHEMEADDPKLYAGLIESISANSRQFPIWKAEYEDLFGRSVSDKKAISELVAELSGNSILDRKMLDALKTVNPSLFSRVSEYIKNWISKTTQDIQKTIGGRKDVAKRFFKDADAAKQAVTESMSEYGQRRQLRRMTDIRPEPDYTVATPNESRLSEMDAKLKPDQPDDPALRRTITEPVEVDSAHGKITFADVTNRPGGSGEFSVKDRPAYADEAEFRKDYEENAMHDIEETPQDFLMRRYCAGRG